MRLNSTTGKIPAAAGRALPAAWLMTAAIAALLTGCFTDSDEGVKLESVELSATRLVGEYTLVDFLYERGDGMRLDTSVIDVTGTLVIASDSTYREGIRIESDSTLTRGRIAGIRAPKGDMDRGELLLTLEGADSSSAGTTAYTFHADTLVLVTEVSKERDAAKKGFRETAYYFRNP